MFISVPLVMCLISLSLGTEEVWVMPGKANTYVLVLSFCLSDCTLTFSHHGF